MNWANSQVDRPLADLVEAVLRVVGVTKSLIILKLNKKPLNPSLMLLNPEGEKPTPYMESENSS
jgi:hypothetical protein